MRQVPITLILLAVAWLVSATQPIIAQDTKENAEFKLAVNLYNDGMNDLALQQLKNFIDAYPSTANGIEARFYLGLTQLRLKRFEDARFTFQNFALSYVDHPKAPEAWIKVGDAFAALKNDLEAAAAYERVKTFHAKSPFVPDALLSAARLYRRTGDTDRARKMLRTILDDYPRSGAASPARLALAEIYIDNNQYELAEQETRHIAGSDASAATKADALTLLGTLQMNTCLFDDAEQTFRQVIASHPGTGGSARAAFMLGKLLLRQMKFQDAGAQFQAALKGQLADNMTAEAAFLAGQAAAGERNYPAALAQFDRVAHDSPGSPFAASALYRAGNTASAKGDFPAAVQYYHQLLSSPAGPMHRLGWIRLAEAHTAANAFADAANAYRSFLAHHPGDPASPAVLLRLGRMFHYKVRDYRKASAAYAELIQQYPRSNEAQKAAEATGPCLESLGDFDGAMEAYLRLLADYPSSPLAGEAQTRITFLQNHHLRKRDTAQDELARLIGEILLDKPRAQLSLRLAEIYYNTLKDYRAAVDHYTSAIDKGLDEQDFIAAYFHRARASDLLGETDSTSRSKALMYYDAFIKQFPADPLSTAASFYGLLLRWKLRPDEDQSARIASLLSASLEGGLREQLLFRAGTHDITAANHGERFALLHTLAQEFPTSPLAQEGLAFAGAWYEQQGRTDSALLLYREALDKTRNGFAKARILSSLLRLTMQESDFSSATAYATMLRDEFPSSDERITAERLLPSLFLAQGKYPESIASARALSQEIEYALDEGADTLNLQFQIASAHDRSGNAEEARNLYRQFLREYPRSEKAAQAYYALGVLARADGNADIAAAYFRQAAAYGGQTGASVEIADLLFQNEQYGEAARQYSALAGAASSPEARKQFQARAVVATLRDNKLPAAQQFIEGYRRMFGEQKEADAEFTYETGLYHFRQQDYVQADKVMDKVGDFKDTRFYPWSLYYRAKILEVTNQLEDAAKRYDEILQNHPASDVMPNVLLSLGNMHFNAERYDQAIKYYQTIIEKPVLAGSVLPFAMNNLIQAYESTTLYDAALKTTKDFIARFPNDESAVDKKIKVGLLYTKLGYFDQAVVHFQKLIDETGSLLEAELRYDIGEAFYYKGDYQQAILEFLKVPYLVSRQGKVNWTATALYMAGQAYEKLSKFPQAMEMYQQIVDRTGIDASFKAAARKEIARVKTITKE